MLEGAEFARLMDPFRRELLAHFYRMLGSVDEAEDLVQETFLRAWRSLGDFEGRSSLRSWLYRIATNACLTALERRARRPLPSGLGGPSEDFVVGAPRWDVAWLQPMPDALLATDDPAAIAVTRGSVRLALVAALQELPARQRAVLLLRDVLGWTAAEVADLVGMTVPAVKSLLQRARATLHRVSPEEEDVVEPADPRSRALLARYVAAFEDTDIGALVELLRDDVALEMPPLPMWFSGRDSVAGFLAAEVFEHGDFRLVPTAANGQPAVAVYLRGQDGGYAAHAIQVLSTTPTGIGRIVVFLDPRLLPRFGLPSIHRHTALTSSKG